MLIDHSLKTTVQLVIVTETEKFSRSAIEPLSMGQFRMILFELLGEALNVLDVSKSRSVLHDQPPKAGPVVHYENPIQGWFETGEITIALLLRQSGRRAPTEHACY